MVFLKHFPHSDAWKPYASLSRSKYDMSFVMVDRVPSNNYEDNEAVIRMIMKGRSPHFRHVSRTDRVCVDWLHERINLDSSMFSRYVGTREQLAAFLTNGAFATIKWKSLMRLLIIHPPPNLNGDRSVSESSCSAVSHNLFTHCRTPTAISATPKVGLGKKSWHIHVRSTLRLGKPSSRTKGCSTGVENNSAWKSRCRNKVGPQQELQMTPLGETQRLTHDKSQLCLERNPMLSSQQGSAETDAHWQDIVSRNKAREDN